MLLCELTPLAAVLVARWRQPSLPDSLEPLKRFTRSRLVTVVLALGGVEGGDEEAMGSAMSL